jgi:predicted transcriptional regulator
MGLLDVYNNMINSQQETEKIAEAQAQATEIVDERMQVLEKYAELADNLLAEEYGNDYEKDDVVKLANLLINHDLEVQEQMEKVAELHEAGIIMAKAFKAELANNE